MACLSVTEDIKGLMVSKGALPTIFKLSRVRALCFYKCPQSGFKIRTNYRLCTGV
jgi:hypothetical protein